MLDQPQDEREQSSAEIGRLLEEVVHRQVRVFSDKFGGILERNLGLTSDDLMSDMREQMWKGILTHDKTKKANIKTYLNKLIENRFIVLYKRARLKKHSSVDYYADAFSAKGVDSEFVVTNETGETLFEKRQEHIGNLRMLTSEDTKVYNDLIAGCSMNEMMRNTGLSRAEVTGAINRVRGIVNRRREGAE